MVSIVHARADPAPAAAPAPASPDGPWLGTWKRNKAKSTSSQAGDSPFHVWRVGDGD